MHDADDNRNKPFGAWKIEGFFESRVRDEIPLDLLSSIKNSTKF